MSLLNKVSQFLTEVQLQLFPIVEEEGPLTNTHKRLITILEIIKVERYIPSGNWLGRPAKDRPAIARAYVAMVVLKLSYVNQLIDYLKSDKLLRHICGWNSAWQIPSESKFCRVFKEFAECELPARAHKLLIKEAYQNDIVMHLTKDSVPLEAREKAIKKKVQKKPTNESTEKKKRGRPQLGEERIVPKTRIEQQTSGSMSLKEMIEDLPKTCDFGAKTSPQGYKMMWKGYKLHTVVDDHCVPITAILTSASTHDSQVAIPLAIQAHDLVMNFYDLMDSAYNIKGIMDHSHSLGHVPIVGPWPKNTAEKLEKDAESKRKKILGFETAEEKRYKLRAKAERFNALFKDHYGGDQIRVREYKKVFCQVMFSLVTLTAAIFIDLVT
jgi:hypothetical protein